MGRNAILYTEGQIIGECIYVKELALKRNGRNYFRQGEFICKCGNHFKSAINNVKSRITKSCGCLHAQSVKKAITTHGKTKTAEFNTWCGIKSRCYNEKQLHYQNYGGRGITVCDRWLNSFDAFLSDMGNKPSSVHSLDRIDVNGNYSKENCRWATPKEQSNNKRNNVYYTINNERKTASEISKMYGLPYSALRLRLMANNNVESVLEKGIKTPKRYSSPFCMPCIIEGVFANISIY